MFCRFRKMTRCWGQKAFGPRLEERIRENEKILGKNGCISFNVCAGDEFPADADISAGSDYGAKGL